MYRNWKFINYNLLQNVNHYFITVIKNYFKKKNIMEESYDNKQQNKKERKNIKKQFFVISCGITLVYSGYSATLSLQSSINIENGEGS